MTFAEAFEQLEDEFRQQVLRDDADQSIFLPTMRATAPVDYVLVGMEPSLGGWTKGKGEARLKDAEQKISEGFRNFGGMWTLHFPVSNYLCTTGETYYVTDLAKGAMLINNPGAGKEEKYRRWYHLLEKEIGLVAKPEAKVISIGSKVGGFLSKMGLYGHAGTINHYSRQARGHWGAEIEGGRREQEYREFSEGFHSILKHTCIPNRECWPGHASGEIALLSQHKRLFFDYKVRFERIKDQEQGGWRGWQQDWHRNFIL